jgi:radical SAM protein with 4Fe4S-binding SPASM domain
MFAFLRKRHDEGGSLPPPDLVEIEPTLGCNLRCVMCHVSYMDEKVKSLDLGALARIAFIGGRHVIIGSVFEPTIHPRFNELIERLNRNRNRIELITNGTRISRLDAPALYDSDLSIVTFSFDGIRKQTFESIRRNADYDKTLRNILYFRERFRERPTHFALNSTLMRRNLDESWETVDFWDRHGFDVARLIFMVVRDPNADLIRESLYPVREAAFAVLDSVAERLIAEKRRISVRAGWYQYSPLRQRFPGHFDRDLVTSGNPATRVVPTLRQDFQLGAAYGMRFPCKSPFTYARILWDGAVQLCQQFVVGNLLEDSFEDIWYGRRAHRIRQLVRSKMDVCNACDYYRYCIKSQEVNVTEKQYYVYDKLQPVLDRIDFERGVVN